MIEQGLKIMVVGMTAVFCFLILMVLTMNVAAWVFTRWAPLFSDESAGESQGEEEIAVALAAIKAQQGQIAQQQDEIELLKVRLSALE